MIGAAIDKHNAAGLLTAWPPAGREECQHTGR